jgi:hypothetical protein
VVDSHEHENEHFGSIKGREFDQLSILLASQKRISLHGVS